MNRKANNKKGIPQQIAGKVENIKHVIKETRNHVLNAEKFVEKGESCIFDSCVDLVLLDRSVKQNPTYGWLCDEVFCLDQKEGCPVKPDIYKIAKSLGEVCAKLQSPQMGNLRNVGCSRWQTIRKALSRYPKDKRDKILNSLASAFFEECGEALTQKVNATAAAANIQPVQKEKSERQKIRDSLNETLKNITDDVMLKALGLYLANFNVPQVAMQNDIAEESEEASATQTQEASPEKSATPNQMSTEEDLGISIPNPQSDNPVTNTPAANTIQPQENPTNHFPILDGLSKIPTEEDLGISIANPQSDNPVTNTPAANTIQPQENPTNPFPILDGLSDGEKAKKIRVWLTKLEGREAYKRDANSYEVKIAWAVVRGKILAQEVVALKTHEDLRKLAETKSYRQFIPMQDKGDYLHP